MQESEMQGSMGRKTSKNESSDQDAGADSEATSKETLIDLEENEVDVEPGSSRSDPGPSPDGPLDEGDETKDAGPM